MWLYIKADKRCDLRPIVKFKKRRGLQLCMKVNQ